MEYLSLLALCLRVPNHRIYAIGNYAHIRYTIHTCLDIWRAQSRERATKLHNLYELSAMAVIFSPKINIKEKLTHTCTNRNHASGNTLNKQERTFTWAILEWILCGDIGVCITNELFCVGLPMCVVCVVCVWHMTISLDPFITTGYLCPFILLPVTNSDSHLE